jgi:hypothetical protein
VRLTRDRQTALAAPDAGGGAANAAGTIRPITVIDAARPGRRAGVGGAGRRHR